MASFTLEDIKAAADAKFGSLDIPLPNDSVTRLLNPMRLSPKKRAALMAAQTAMGELEEKSKGDLAADELVAEQERLIDETILAAAETEAAGRQLLKHLPDVAAKMIVLEKYGEGTEMGEASSSQS